MKLYKMGGINMRVINLKEKQLASEHVATEIVKLIISKPNTVLGLATGGTMTDVYQYLVKLINANNLDMSDVVTFNLDEYVGLSPEDKQSYHEYMQERLFKYNDTWNDNNIHIPSGVGPDLEVEAYNYEQQIEQCGPIDLQLLGIGENGHIGFNEPGTSFNSRTRVVNLTPSTIQANSVNFDNVDDVPVQAVSMGLSSIMGANHIILLAFGDKKIDAVKRLLQGDVSTDLPASILHQHQNVDIYVDDVIFNKLKEDNEL